MEVASLLEEECLAQESAEEYLEQKSELAFLAQELAEESLEQKSEPGFLAQESADKFLELE